jgi:4'-phosphopantetheinyl transferase
MDNYSKKIVINKDEVHIWSVRLDVPDGQAKMWQLYLSRDELQRAQQFLFAKERNHFIIARGVLRKILSHYIEKQPYEIRFNYNKYGKPFLPHEFSGERFRFNLSHSYGICLYAISLNREVGIDIEYIREDFSDLEIAQRFFSPDEVKALQSLPVADQKRAFFLCWTRKEAFIKAKGKGLSVPLDQFDVSLIPDQPAKLLRTKYDRHDVNRWSLFNIDLFAGYTAALVVEGQNLQIKYQNSKDLLGTQL